MPPILVAIFRPIILEISFIFIRLDPRARFLYFDAKSLILRGRAFAEALDTTSCYRAIV